MSNLNIKCSICSEFYKTNERVYSTLCGHLFHYNCLHRWLINNDNCPQCRRSCHRHRIHRVYLDYDVASGPLDDETDTGYDYSNTPIWIPLDEHMGAPGQSDEVPEGAILLAKNPYGDRVYVARIYFGDDLLPANYIPERGGAYAAYAGRAQFLSRNFVEILIDCKCKWVTDSAGHVPPNAIVTGYTESGENLYTARAVYNGLLLGGKVHPSHKVCYLPYNGQEVNVNVYEVLVHDQSDETPLATTNATNPTGNVQPNAAENEAENVVPNVAST